MALAEFDNTEPEFIADVTSYDLKEDASSCLIEWLVSGHRFSRRGMVVDTPGVVCPRASTATAAARGGHSGVG